MNPCRRRLARLAALAVLTAALLPAAGCAYAKDRVYDLSDVIDPKLGSGLGIGAKAELTYYLGAGGGVGVQGWLWEWYGRKAYETYGDKFAHFAIFGQDGGMYGPDEDAGKTARPDTYALLLNLSAYVDHYPEAHVMGFSDAFRLPDGYEVPPLHTRWRLGAEVMIPALSFGLYLNVAELGDFLLGFTTLDYQGDDGIGKTETYQLGVPPEITERQKVKERQTWKRN
ncbi:MAG: hypothetical protein DRQ55_15520 [Planctomycetota bacterium]|nr:MAG: hypothetical protein DRQ55_15520 [Planctomycetota bacterium]